MGGVGQGRANIKGKAGVRVDEQIITIAEHYGLPHQTLKLIEECAELIVAVAKGKKNRENTIEELADVSIMISQAVYLMKVEKEFTAAKKSKIERQLLRIKKENAK